MRLKESYNTFWGALRNLIYVIRLQPFDISTPAGRANERHRRIALTALASACSQFVSIITALLIVPHAIGYLGNERYGMWMTMSSVILILGFADMGMGNGLLAAISRASGNDDEEMARSYVSGGFFALMGIAILVMLMFALTYPYIPWQRAFNLKSELASREAGPAMWVMLTCLALNMPLGVVQRIQMAYQEGYISNIWQAISGLLGLAGVLLAIQYKTSLPWLALALAGAPTVCYFLNGLILFGIKRPRLRVTWRRVEVDTCRTLLRLGVLFFLLQLTGAICYASDNIILAHMLGAEAVTVYAVTYKLFLFAPQILSFMLIPLWPAYSESIARGDIAWVKKSLTRSIMIGFIVNVPPALLLMGFGAHITHLWIGPQVTPPAILRIGIGMWAIINSITGPIVTLFNGASAIAYQVKCMLLMSISKLLLSILLVHMIGVSGVIYGTLIAEVLFIDIPFIIYIPHLLRSLQASSTANGRKGDAIDATNHA